jgi:hypothetical protein
MRRIAGVEQASAFQLALKDNQNAGNAAFRGL